MFVGKDNLQKPTLSTSRKKTMAASPPLDGGLPQASTSCLLPPLHLLFILSEPNKCCMAKKKKKSVL